MTEKVTVQLTYKDVKKTFSAPPEETWLLLNKFFSELIPSFEIANKLLLNVDLQELAKECQGLIAFSKEGASLLVSRSKLTDNETLLTWLLAGYMGHELGMLEREELSKEALQAKLGKSGKITSTRLGELVKNDVVAKTVDDTFKLTTFGVVQMQKEILPKIRAKVKV